MAALAADVNCSVLGTPIYASFSANGADVFYQGAVVFIDTGGGVQVVPAAGDRCVGICTKQQTITAAAQLVEVMVFGLIWLPVGTNIAAADEGNLCVLDIGSTQSDNPADFVSDLDITAAGDDASLGRILRVTSTQMLVFVTPGTTGQLYVATAGWGG